MAIATVMEGLAVATERVPFLPTFTPQDAFARTIAWWRDKAMNHATP